MKRVTAMTFRDMKKRGEKTVMLTAYDYPSARLVDQAGIDGILIGDSLGMTVLGYDSTLPVTMEDMLHHVRAVARAARRSLVIADMPFLSYQVNSDEALRNAGRFLQEAGAQAVKLEGGRPVAETIQRIVSAGIPVMGHLGLTPQSVHALGGYGLQGADSQSAHRILDDARRLEDAGAFAVVLEKVPSELAERVTGALSIPTIGIGSGAGCDGQVLVFHDILGLSDGFRPKFLKVYAELGRAMAEAFERYRDEVKSGAYPVGEHAWSMDPTELDKLGEDGALYGGDHSDSSRRMGGTK